MLSSAGSIANVHRRPLIVKMAFEATTSLAQGPDILDRFFGKPRPNVRVIR